VIGLDGNLLRAAPTGSIHVLPHREGPHACIPPSRHLFAAAQNLNPSPLRGEVVICDPVALQIVPEILINVVLCTAGSPVWHMPADKAGPWAGADCDDELGTKFRFERPPLC